MILTDINYKKIIKKFLGEKKEIVDEFTTSFDKSEIFLLDSNKNREKWKICMLDSKFNFLSNHTNVRCWWDKHSINTAPIGCPIRYHTDKSVYYSAFCGRLENCNIPMQKNITYDFFETEGIFCSFCCIMSYIDEEVKKGNTRYSDYIPLVYLLFQKLKNVRDVKIPCASTWKILANFGGDTTIDSYRNKISDFFYEETGSYKRPYMITTPFYVKENPPKYLN